MEPALRADLSVVRVHSGPAAARAAAAVGSLAFTRGQHIYLGAGQPTANSQAGGRLLAHEVAHTVQAARHPGGGSRHPHPESVSTPSDPAERQAAAAADTISGGGVVNSALDAVPRADVLRQQAGAPSDAGPSDAGSSGSPDMTAGAGGSPLEQVRAAMAETNPVAGVGNFPKAWGILNGLPMPDLLRTLDALQPMGELDVLNWNIGSATPFDVPRLRAAVAAVTEAHTGLNPVSVTDDYRTLPATQQADLTNFIETVGRELETSSLHHASRYLSPGANRGDVLQQLGVVSRSLASTTGVAARFGDTEGLLFLEIMVERRLARLRANPAEIPAWTGQVAAQRDIVSRCATGLAFAAGLLDSAAGTDGAPVPDYVRLPVTQVARAYIEVLRNADLVDVAYPRLESAEALARVVQIAILESTVADAQRLLDESTKMSPLGAGLKPPSTNFAADLKTAREFADADPEAYTAAVSALQQKIATLHKHTIAINTRAQFDSVLNSINDLSLQAQQKGYISEPKELWGIVMRITPYRLQWSALEEAYDTGDTAAQAANWAIVRAGAKQLQALLAEADAKVESVARMMQRDELIFRLAIMVLIGLATGGFGEFLVGFAGGLELGAGTTFVLVNAGQALFFTTASAELLEKDVTVRKFLVDLAVNFATFSAMNLLMVGYRGVLGPAAKTLGGRAGEVVVGITAQTMTALALADRQKRSDTGQGLTEGESHQIMLESVVVAVATMVGARVTHDLLPDFRARGSKFGVRLAEINRNRAELRLRAAQITGTPRIAPGTAGMASSGPHAKAAPSKAAAPRSLSEVEVDRAQRLLDDDGALLKTEKTTLEDLKAEAAKTPASSDATAIDTALAQVQGEAAANEAARIATALEPVGPDEALCQQDRFDEVARYHRKNSNQTVTEGVDPEGARYLQLTSKEPGTAKAFRITERITPGSGKTSASGPVSVPPEVVAPTQPAFKAFSDILNPDGTFQSITLEEAYSRYRQRKTVAKENVKDRTDWARAQSSGDYRPQLLAELGPAFFKQGRTFPLRDIPRPMSYSAERYLADYAETQPYLAEVVRKAGIDPAVGLPDGRISEGAFNGAKGEVGEIMARRVVADILTKIRTKFPRAVLMRRIMARFTRGGKAGPWKQFTDGVIGYWDGANLKLLGRVEVKSGGTGGQQATVQFWEWVEGRLERGMEVKVPGHDPVVYGPTSEQRAAGMGHVDGLANAQSHIITPKGAEHLGQGSEMRTVTEHQRHPLDQTPSEIEFLTRLVLERFVRPAAIPATSIAGNAASGGGTPQP